MSTEKSYSFDFDLTVIEKALHYSVLPEDFIRALFRYAIVLQWIILMEVENLTLDSRCGTRTYGSKTTNCDILLLVYKIFFNLSDGLSSMFDMMSK